MKYRNTKTGAVIDSPCTITGGYWESIKPGKAPADVSGDAKTSGQPLTPGTSAAARANVSKSDTAKLPKKATRKKASK